MGGRPRQRYVSNISAYCKRGADTVEYVGDDESDVHMGDLALPPPLKHAKYWTLQLRINNNQEADSISILILDF